MESLYGLFTIIAQVSFAIAGLLFLAITISEQRTKYWLDGENVNFLGQTFLMIVFPGFISLFGLVPHMHPTPLAASAIAFYFTLFLFRYQENRRASKIKAEHSRQSWFGKIWSIKNLIFVFCFWLAALFPGNQSFFLIGSALVLTTIFSTFVVFSIFRNS